VAFFSLFYIQIRVQTIEKQVNLKNESGIYLIYLHMVKNFSEIKLDKLKYSKNLGEKFTIFPPKNHTFGA
jgi:hypothetical protein